MRTHPAVPGPGHPLVRMQGVLGNSGVQRMLIQRFPTRDGIVTRLGKPKRSIRIGHGSKKYKDVLDAVGDYQDYVRGTKLVKGSASAQFQLVMTALARIETAAQGYLGKTGAKATYMLNALLPAVASERSLASQTLLRVVTGGFANLGDDHTLANAMLMSVTAAKPKALNSANATGADRGGMSEVTKFNMGGNKQGFFKETKNTLTDLSGGPEAEQALLEKVMGEVPPEKVVETVNSLKGEYDLGVDLAGINAKDAHMANRDVAMSRIDQLLGANVIARAQLAVMTTPGGEKTGSIMEAAQGKQASKLMQKGRMATNAVEKANVGDKAVNQQDPEMMRLLSKLQLVDLLCVQVDRNPKNFFIQMDGTGKVTGITGIDNDMALGVTTSIDKRKQELPGLSRYVDKELAEKIINLDLSLVRLILIDLLSPAEIDALIERFKKVQDHLRANQTQLLQPDQWTAAVAQGLTDEGKSYWADLGYNKGKYGG